jgi:hypothetical protein
MNIAKKYYHRLRVHEFKECKLMATNNRMCRQNYSVQVKYISENCEAELLQVIRNIVSSSSQRKVKPNQTLWTQLNNDGCIYVAPVVDKLTVLCSGEELSDVQIHGTGKLKLHGVGKGYETRNSFRPEIPLLQQWIHSLCCVRVREPLTFRNMAYESSR